MASAAVVAAVGLAGSGVSGTSLRACHRAASSRNSALPLCQPPASAQIAARRHHNDALSMKLLAQRQTQPQRSTQAQASRRITSMAAQNRNVLIVNTNSGGHVVIGFWLAKHLAQDGHSVTFLTVGAESSDKMKKQPFNRLGELRDLGVKTIWGEPSDIGPAVGSSKFHVVVDNNGKDMEAVGPVADWAKGAGVEQFLFVSSAGIYVSSDQQPHVEGDKVKEDSGHAQVERHLKGLGLPHGFAAFRPQYITGDGNNKDCEEWFFDRIVRDRPVPIPGSGMQMTVIAHAADLASMIAAAVTSPEKAKDQIFNCVSDRAVTFDGLVRLCGAAAGKTPKIVHYDPKAAGVDAKKAFPFRNQHFYSEPRAAKHHLGWTAKRRLGEELKERFAAYVASGRDKKAIEFPLDDQILKVAK